MRRSTLAAAICAIALAAPGSAAEPRFTRPPQPQQVADPRMEGTAPLDLSIKHELFLEPVTESLDALKEVRLERYLWTAVPMGRIVVFPDHDLRPSTAFRLTDIEYARWKKLNGTSARDFLDAIATRSLRSLLPPTLRKSYDPQWRTGFSDRFSSAIDRSIPYVPYLEAESVRFGLPREAWMLAYQESFFNPSSVSKASCEGPYQLSRPVARLFGLIVPKGKSGGNTTNVNESKHPLLAAQAAFSLWRAYAYHSGGVLPGMSDYHAGPENGTKMELLHLRDPSWRADTRGSDGHRRAQEYLDGLLPDPVTTENGAAEKDNALSSEEEPSGLESTKAVEALSWAVTDGWRHPNNRSQFRRASAQYAPRFLGVRNALRRDAFYEPVREIVGQKRVRTGNGECSSVGPYTGDGKRCLETVPDIRSVERYRFAAFEADRITVRYATAQRAGREPITGRDLRTAFGDPERFADYNPHIPLGARIPDGTRVFVPLGRGVAFAASPSLRGLLRPDEVVAYEGGRITPEPSTPEILPEDREYARLGLLRSQGRHDQIAPSAVCDLADRMRDLAAATPTWFRALQERVARLDCVHTDGKNTRTLIEFAKGGKQ